jgi:hypothetical protein
LELPDPTSASPLATCGGFSDCAQGEVCEVGFCVVEDAPARRVALLLTPPSGSSLLPNLFVPVEVRQGAPLPDLEVQRPKLLVGEVRVEGESAPINARVVLLQRRDEVGERALRYEAQGSRDGGYSLQLPAGVYDIQILPDREDLPPQRLTGFPIQGDTRHDFVLESPARSTQIEGRVVVRLPGVGESIPADEVRVLAVDDGELQVSTEVETQADGRFSLAVRSDVRRLSLLLTPQGPDDALPRVRVADLQPTGSRILLGDLSLGELRPAGREVVGEVRDLDGQPVEGASVRISSQQLDGAPEGASLSRVVTAGPQGRFSARLADGVYTVLVTPPDASRHALSERDAWVVSSDTGTEVFLVDRRMRLPGRVLHPSRGVGVAEVSVVLRARKIFGVRDLGAGRTYRLTSDAQGAFEAWVEPGEYDIDLTPPQDAGASRATLQGVSIGLDAPELALTLARSNVAYGTVVGPQGEQLPDVQVEVFSLDEDPPRLLGAGTTNQDGAYRVLVPSAAP